MQTGRRTFIKHALAGGVTLSGLGGILYSRQAPAVDPHSKHLTATLKDLDGATVFTKRLDAKPARDGRWD